MQAKTDSQKIWDLIDIVYSPIFSLKNLKAVIEKCDALKKEPNLNDDEKIILEEITLEIEEIKSYSRPNRKPNFPQAFKHTTPNTPDAAERAFEINKIPFPKEMLRLILSYTDAFEHASLRLVSKDFKDIIDSFTFGKFIYYQPFNTVFRTHFPEDNVIKCLTFRELRELWRHLAPEKKESLVGEFVEELINHQTEGNCLNASPSCSDEFGFFFLYTMVSGGVSSVCSFVLAYLLKAKAPLFFAGTGLLGGIGFGLVLSGFHWVLNQSLVDEMTRKATDYVLKMFKPNDVVIDIPEEQNEDSALLSVSTM